MPHRLVLGLGSVVAALAAGSGCTPTPPISSSAPGLHSHRPPPGVTSRRAPPPAVAPAPRSPPPVTPAVVAIEVGPGPQTPYRVEPQPAPGACHYTYLGPDPLPDPRCTPGAVNPQVTEADIGSTICAAGFTSAIRPPERITEPEKAASAAAYGYAGSFHVAEYDHLIPLELGGDPNDPANLWVEPPDDPHATTFTNAKDGLENRLRALVCSGRLTLSAAQQAIAGSWVAALRTYGG